MSESVLRETFYLGIKSIAFFSKEIKFNNTLFCLLLAVTNLLLEKSQFLLIRVFCSE